MRRYPLLIAALLAWTTKADPTTLGCVAPDILTLLLVGLIGGTFTNIASPSACATRCIPTGRSFAYYNAANARCYCANTGPNISQLTSSVVPVALSSSTPLCAAASYHVQTLGLPFELQSCALPSTITGVTIPPTSPRTINACLTACTNLYSYALVTLGSASTCTCAKGVVVAAGGIGICQAGSTAVYRNLGVLDPAPSGARKRRKLEEDRRLCPGRLDACLIAEQDEDSFECLDSQVELESCGGCLHGAVDSFLDTRRGIDCSAIPGVALGGVTCEEGRCIITKCKRGYTVVPDKCLKRM